MMGSGLRGINEKTTPSLIQYPMLGDEMVHPAWACALKIIIRDKKFGL